MKKIEGGITAAKGFQAAGGAAGIKKQGVKEMALCPQRGTVRSSRNLYYKHRKSSSGQMGMGDCIQPSNRTGNRLQQWNRQCMHRRGGLWLLQKRRGSISCTFHSRGLRSPLHRPVLSENEFDRQDRKRHGMLKPQLAATREATSYSSTGDHDNRHRAEGSAVQIESAEKP